MISFEEATQAFQHVISWDHESAEELDLWVKIVDRSTFELMRRNLMVTLREFTNSVELTDAVLRKHDGSILIPDRTGHALFGDPDNLRVIDLSTPVSRASA